MAGLGVNRLFMLSYYPSTRMSAVPSPCIICSFQELTFCISYLYEIYSVNPLILAKLQAGFYLSTKVDQISWPKQMLCFYYQRL